MSPKKPFVSILLVNYNGKHLLERAIPPLLAQDYGIQHFEVIVVDNASRDGSVEFLKNTFPSIKVVPASTNLGFSNGNIAGLKVAKGDAIVLLNTDVIVTPNWLSELEKAARDKKVGMVGSKLLFSTPFIPITIKTPYISKSEISHSTDFSPVGILLEEIQCQEGSLTEQVWYDSGFSPVQQGDLAARWTLKDARVLLPFPSKSKSQEYLFTFHGYKGRKSQKVPYEIYRGEKLLCRGEVNSQEVKQENIKISSAEAKESWVWLVQNAGNVVMRSGLSKDRGSLLRIDPLQKELREFYEEDNKYFNEPARLLALCGASCYIKRELIEKIGFLDGHYYMYYEDSDLSLRAWRMGYDLVYAPKSVAYHEHRATTGKTFSEFFLFQTERNHLFFVMTHFPLSTVFQRLLMVGIRFGRSLVKSLLYKFFSENLTEYNRTVLQTRAHKNALIEFLKLSPMLFKNRFFWKKQEVRSYNEMQKWLY